MGFEFGLHGEGEEFFDLGQGENDGEGFVGFWEIDFGDGVSGETATVNEELEEGTIGREAQADGAAGEVLFLEVEEVGAEGIGGKGGPSGEFLVQPLAEETESVGVVFEGFGGGIFFVAEEVDEGIEVEVGEVIHGTKKVNDF